MLHAIGDFGDSQSLPMGKKSNRNTRMVVVETVWVGVIQCTRVQWLYYTCKLCYIECMLSTACACVRSVNVRIMEQRTRRYG